MTPATFTDVTGEHVWINPAAVAYTYSDGTGARISLMNGREIRVTTDVHTVIATLTAATP